MILFSSTSALAANLVQIEQNIQKTLNKYCADCHDDETQKGEKRFDNFVKLDDNQKASLLSHVEEQVFTETMPPKKKTQLSATDRKNLFASIKKWYDLSNQNSQFRSKLQMPEYGNYVDHNKLFSGEYKNLKGFTYDRDWLISEFIFAEKMNRLLQLSESNKYDGKTQTPNGQVLNPEVVNPFKLPHILPTTPFQYSLHILVLGLALRISPCAPVSLLPLRICFRARC